MGKYRIEWRDEDDAWTVWELAKNDVWVRFNEIDFLLVATAFEAVVFQAHMINTQTTYTVEVIE